jgi:nicotinamide phosphoribosyltransferase
MSSFNVSPMLLKDFYKTDHRRQYPKGTEYVYSNFTPRDSRVKGIDKAVVFGPQFLVQEYLIDQFNQNFFALPKEDAVGEYKRRMDTALGPNAIDVSHIAELHDLGYLPLEVKALPEGSLCPLKVPMMTVRNTDPRFFWLTNALETLISCSLWYPVQSATTAFEYRKILTSFANATSDMLDFVPWQGHDFSMRGMTSPESAMVSGAAHLLSFTGTDTIPSIDWLEHYYNADAEKELIGGSVPATEHSVMCLGGAETELQTFNRLITEVYPSGIVSIVSDTWDYWHVLSDTLVTLKSTIMARNGKVVVRPDSGDPVKIICGDPSAPVGSIQYKGSIEHLWEVFGGAVNSKGFKQLDSHIGLIYGDSITLERAQTICQQLKDKGFASTNVVFGVGSYTYQYVTRDTLGFAMKATHGVVNGLAVDIFKDPKTDNGVKKSAKGLLRVNADYSLSQQCTPEEEKQGLLQTIFKDGVAYNTQTLSQVRARLLSNI